MPIVALTGGVAAGKSTVAEELAAGGAIVVDADLLARKAVEAGSPALEDIVRSFGAGVLDASGNLDRSALATKIFDDDVARQTLNSIVHPVVRLLSEEEFSRAQSESPERVLVYVVPLLVESRQTQDFDLVVVVDAPADVRVRRLMEHRGLTAEQALSRVSSQASDAERLAIADVVLDASGGLTDTIERARELSRIITGCWPDRLSEVPGLYRDSQS
jgi:dephospho-CoA kinase